MRLAESAAKKVQILVGIVIAAGIILGGSVAATAHGLQFKVAKVDGTNQVIHWDCGTHPVLSTGLSTSQVLQLRRALRQLRHGTGGPWKPAGKTPKVSRVLGICHNCGNIRSKHPGPCDVCNVDD